MPVFRHAISNLCIAITGAITAIIAIHSSAFAQVDTYDEVFDVAFFERVAVGDVEITPIGIIEESRCEDPELCFRNDDLIVSAILHRPDGQSERMVEIPLRLGSPTPVPGGELLLTNAGAAPVRRGSIPLDRYSLDIEFIPEL